jgi:ACS family glucarate transporter-like MFS transporter
LLNAALWHVYSTETPQEHPAVNAMELRLIASGRPPAQKPATPWKRMMSGATVPALMLSNFLVGYVMYIFYTWFFLYLVNVRHFAIMSGSYWSTAPFVAILIAAPLGGYVSDVMVRRLGHPWGRRVPVLICATACAILVMTGSRVQNPYAAIGLLAFAAGCNCVVAVTQWTLPNDISTHNAGAVAGVLNTTTNLGGALSPVLTPYIADRWGWITAFDFSAALLVVVFAIWFLVHPERKLD